jgi:hypothetical protein
MSRGKKKPKVRPRRPSRRNLIGPFEILDRIESAGGVPDEIVDHAASTPRTAASKKAADAMDELFGRVSEPLLAAGAELVTAEDDINRKTAWLLSVTNSMKESVPRNKWCRHIRAADPNVTEIRTVAVPKAGVWLCLECLKQAGPKAIAADLWPTECDLCGAETTEFNAMLGNIPGCQVELHVCNQCAMFNRPAE